MRARYLRTIAERKDVEGSGNRDVAQHVVCNANRALQRIVYPAKLGFREVPDDSV